VLEPHVQISSQTKAPLRSTFVSITLPETFMAKSRKSLDSWKLVLADDIYVDSENVEF